MSSFCYYTEPLKMSDLAFRSAAMPQVAPLVLCLCSRPFELSWYSSASSVNSVNSCCRSRDFPSVTLWKTTLLCSQCLRSLTPHSLNSGWPQLIATSVNRLFIVFRGPLLWLFLNKHSPSPFICVFFKLIQSRYCFLLYFCTGVLTACLSPCPISYGGSLCVLSFLFHSWC